MDKCFIVTGGAQGIGRAICKEILDNGNLAIMSDTDQEALEESRSFLSSRNLRTFHADAGSEADIRSLFTFASSLKLPLHGIVNSAGIAINAPITELTLEQWKIVQDTNVTSVFLTTKYGVPLMPDGASIVNISSIRSIMTSRHTDAYSASKGAVLSLTSSLAVSLGPKIRVNAVVPGWIDVSMEKKQSQCVQEPITKEDLLLHPLEKIGTAVDIAKAVWYLLSPDSSFITGSHIVVDGGITRRLPDLPVSAEHFRATLFQH